MAHDFVELVRDGLTRLRQADPRFEVFGASTHRYELLPPISRVELDAFEATHNIRLPEGYRRFLLEIGNGGAGPHYGLFPLGMWDGTGSGLEPWGEFGAGVLSDEFPHSAHWNLPAERFAAPEFSDDEAEDAWQTALDDEYWNPALTAGSFPIAHQGCAYRNVLVVTGPARGLVWLDGRASDQGIGPEERPEQLGPTFEDWYLGWLENSLCARGAS